MERMNRNRLESAPMEQPIDRHPQSGASPSARLRALALGALLGLAALPAQAASKIYYYHNDHLGTPQAMTDQGGQVVWKADQEPFGKMSVTVATIGNNTRFPGQYFDQETGLHYNYFRDYDPTIGRYIESDPIGVLPDIGKPRNPGELNHLYAYVENNPLRFIDPLGLIHEGTRCLIPGTCECATAECAAGIPPNPQSSCEAECAIMAFGGSNPGSFPASMRLVKEARAIMGLSSKVTGGIVGQFVIDPLLSIPLYQSCVQTRCREQKLLCPPDDFTGS